ncbi:MAG: hypothetical protein OEY20_18150 [Gemmatimonadota bacterium]|nr:hypothetical protein [Gemmatimonadota bacterium]
MRRAALLLVPLLLFACDRQPVAPEVVGPSLNASGDHRALVLTSTGDGWLFDGAGNIVQMTCRDHEVYTNNTTGFVKVTSQCMTENPTGRAVKFTPDDNPFGSDLCAGWPDPSGEWYSLCEWQEVLAASGKVSFSMWGTPIY